MKLKEALADLILHPEKYPAQTYYHFEDMCRDLRLDYYELDIPEIDYKQECAITVRDLKTWICTDTRVGCLVFMMGNEIIGYSLQSARKDDEYFYWVNKETRQQAYEYLHSLRTTNHEYVRYDDVFDLDLDDVYSWQHHRN